MHFHFKVFHGRLLSKAIELLDDEIEILSKIC